MQPGTLSRPELTAADRCDRCGAAAKVRAVLPSGGELLFCGHHARAHGDKMRELELKASEEGKHALAQRYQRVGKTLRERDLLGFLANRNILPKYGFPVDSVELRTNFGLGQSKGGLLDLSRASVATVLRSGSI